MSRDNRPHVTPLQSLALLMLRVAIGWHFAFEGYVKIVSPDWSAKDYLESANWIGADLFHWMAANETVLSIVNVLNAWGLLLIGLALMVGCLTRLASLGGVALLGLYYMAHPSLLATGAASAEGSYLLVNKNLIEMFALLVVLLLPMSSLGVDGLWRVFFSGRGKSKKKGAPSDTDATAPALPRRAWMASMIGLPFVGALAAAVVAKHRYQSVEEDQLAERIDAMSGASIKRLEVKGVDKLKAQVPTAKIGDVTLSRLIMGGNLMNGFAHARDLIYVSDLIKSYHNQYRINETFQLAEKCGVNTIITNPVLAPNLVEYREQTGGQMQFMAQLKGKFNDKDKAVRRQGMLDEIQYSIENGMCAGYVQGMAADHLVEIGDFETIELVLKTLRDAGMPAGIGGHYIRTIRGCVDHGLEPDFWMKTLHSHAYWSSDTENQHDNIWCEDPEETIATMEDLPQPWIAFKVLAAGAIAPGPNNRKNVPAEGFRYAFENGADFICVGMYDFQVVDDANLVVDLFDPLMDRKRKWMA